jgi:hypothetical protein
MDRKQCRLMSGLCSIRQMNRIRWSTFQQTCCTICACLAINVMSSSSSPPKNGMLWTENNIDWCISWQKNHFAPSISDLTNFVWTFWKASVTVRSVDTSIKQSITFGNSMEMVQFGKWATFRDQHSCNHVPQFALASPSISSSPQNDWNVLDRK